MASTNSLQRRVSVVARGPNIRKAKFMANNSVQREFARSTKPITKKWDPKEGKDSPRTTFKKNLHKKKSLISSLTLNNPANNQMN